MKESELAEKLTAIVKKHCNWDEDFSRLTVMREDTWTEVYWTDSGVGEHYVLDAVRKEWPGYTFDLDEEGGCGTCGYGRGLTLTVYSAVPPWEVA